MSSLITESRLTCEKHDETTTADSEEEQEPACAPAKNNTSLTTNEHGLLYFLSTPKLAPINSILHFELYHFTVKFLWVFCPIQMSFICIYFVSFSLITFELI